jgi:tetratricopeptide (TPR) repeat protein
MSRPRQLAPLLLALLAAACAQAPEKPAPVAPQITERSLRDRAREQLALGVTQYQAGEYELAMKSLQTALDHGLLEKSEQSLARKHLAFIHCVSNREAPCAEQFRKAFEIDPAFLLSQAEDGHPVWGPVYRNVRMQLIAERDAGKVKPAPALGKAEQMLADGLLKYETGSFEEAQQFFQAAFREGLRNKADQVKALKHSAFCLCLAAKYPACRVEFLKIYDIDADFDLKPAEAGHPQWMKTFAAARAQARREQADKAAKTRADAASAKPSTATAPSPASPASVPPGKP